MGDGAEFFIVREHRDLLEISARGVRGTENPTRYRPDLETESASRDRKGTIVLEDPNPDSCGES